MPRKSQRRKKLQPAAVSPGTIATAVPSYEEKRQYVHDAVLLGVVALVYLLTFSASHYGRISDGEEMFQTALSIYEFKDLRIFNKEFRQGSDLPPSTYSKFGLGFPLVLQIPLWIADHLDPWLGWQKGDCLFAFTNLLLNLLTAFLLAAAARRLDFSLWAAYGAAIGFALGSFAWPYISYDFSEPLQAFCLVLAFWALLHVFAESRTRWFWLALSGLSLGYCILTKSLLLVVLPAFAFYLWRRTGGTVYERLQKQLIFWSPLVLWGMVIAGLNMLRFQSFFEFGYKQETSWFTTPLWTGFYGLLLSPNKGMLFYAPVTLLLPFAMWFLFRHRRHEFVFVGVLSVSIILPVSKWWSWEGGASWGPRLLYPLLPFLMLFAAHLLDHRKAARYWFACLLLVGIAINLMGVLFYFSTWGVVCGSNGDLVALDIEGRPEGEYQLKGGERYFYPYVAASYHSSLSPILGHAWVLRWRYCGMPFSLFALESQPPIQKVLFGPVSINFERLKEICAANPSLQRDLESAQLLLPSVWHAREADQGRSPIRGKAFLYFGLRFSGEKAFSKAYYAYRRAYELGSESPSLLPNLGITCFRLGKISEGSGYFDQCLAKFPAQPEIRLLYAQSLESSRQYRKALEHYVRLKELHPTHSNIAFIEQRIATLSQMAQTNAK